MPNRAISAVCIHIVPEEALAGAAVGVRIEEPLDDGIVISGLEVIEASLFGWAVAGGEKEMEILAALEVGKTVRKELLQQRFSIEKALPTLRQNTSQFVISSSGMRPNLGRIPDDCFEQSTSRAPRRRGRTEK